jgi:hypothetical protein
VASAQQRAYDETVTGLFLSLVDFETDAEGLPGYEQVDWFGLTGPSGGDKLTFAANITSTGAGALQADLSPGSGLVLDVPGVTDLSDYTLLSTAIHSETLRDDLRITLVTDRGSHRSEGHLVRPGWNVVHVDLQRLRARRGVDLTGVRRIRWDFPRSAGPVRIRLDDVLLIDNAREVLPTPPGVTLRKNGLDWRIDLAGRDDPLHLSQGDDGLWRLGEAQPKLTLIAPEGADANDPLAPLGSRTRGEVELLETNDVRTRLAVRWFFPDRAGEWASMAVRQVRWEYTFYADGRWVTHLSLNSAGGGSIREIRIAPPQVVAWSDGKIAPGLRAPFTGPVGRWSWLSAGENPPGREFLRQYAEPGSIRPILAGEADQPGSSGGGYDPSQGCYVVMARRGACRFELIPPAGGLVSPVVRVTGLGEGKVTAAAEGLALRTIARGRRDSVLLIVPGTLAEPLTIEVRGELP